MKQLSLLAIGLPVALFVGNSSGQTWPAEWLDAPFGTVRAADPGWAAYDENEDAFTLAGSGADMYGAANDGARFVFQPLLGDCEIIAVVPQLTDTNLYPGARAGIMLREHNGRGSRHFEICHMRGTGGDLVDGRVNASGRAAPDTAGSSGSVNGFTADPLPMRIIRKGNDNRAYVMTNATWTQFRQFTGDFGEAVNAGVFALSGNPAAPRLAVLTNTFASVAARPLVAVLTNAAAGFDVTWITDQPGLSNGWDYTATLVRQAEGGPLTTQAVGLASAAYTDPDIAPGVRYRYAAVAVPVPQDGLDTPPELWLGTSAATRYPYASTNLAPAAATGWFAAYYSPTNAILPIAARVETCATNAAVPPAAGVTNGYRAVLNASLVVDETDTYTFLTESDDGVKLSVGDAEVLNAWYAGTAAYSPLSAQSGPVRLEAGRAYPVRLDYFQNTGDRALSLKWRRTGAPEVTDVPVAAFHPVPLPWRHEDIGDVTENGNAAFDPATGAVTLSAAGNGLDTAADAAHLLSRDVTGAFDLTARLDALTAGRAGLTLRAGRAPGTVAFTLTAAQDGGVWTLALASRTADDTVPAVAATATQHPAASPVWLRLSLAGTRLAASWRAAPDAAWTPLGAFPAPVAPLAAYTAGLIASSGSATFGAFGADLFPASAGILPTHDTFVQDNNSLNGASSTIVLKHEGNSTQREGFLRFDVSGATDIRSAVLRLCVQSRPVTPCPVVVRALPGYDWDENTATWTNAPGGMPVATSFISESDPGFVGRIDIPSAGQYAEFDATEAVRRAAAGDGDITFNLLATIRNSSTIGFYSKEAANAAQRPALVLVHETPQRVAADGGPAAGSIAVTWAAYPGAAAYRVTRAASAEGPYTPVGGDLADTRFTDTGLAAGARFWYRVAAVTAEGETAPSAPVWADAPAAVTAFVADEDTYVNGSGSGGQYAGNNYGNNTGLTIKYNATDQYYHREAYLRFDDIRTLGQAGRVTLRLTPSTAGPGDPALMTLQAFLLPPGDWDEMAVTFNNPPPGVTPPTARLADDGVTRVSAPCVAVNQPLDLDVTAMVRESLRVNPGGKMGIGLIRLDNQGNINCTLCSSEHGTAAYRPRLLGAFGRAQPPAATVTNGRIALAWSPYPAATSMRLRRAEAPEGPYTLVADTTATALTDAAALGGVTWWYTLAAVTPSGETEASLPVPARVDIVEKRYPLADTNIDNNTADRGAIRGASTTLGLKWSPYRECLFKFAVADLADVPQARLRVKVQCAQSDFTPVNWIVRALDLGDWNEAGVCWNVPPPGYANFASSAATVPGEVCRIRYETVDSNGNRYIEADVTEAVRQAARDGKRLLTLTLAGDSTLWSNPVVGSVFTREQANEAYRPCLLLNTGRFGAPLGLEAEAAAAGFTLTWRPAAGAVRYIVTRQGPTDDAPVLLADDVAGTSFTDADPAFWNDRDYTYTVTAVHADGALSEAASVTRTLTRAFTAPVAADCFVRGGTYAGTTNSLSPIIEVKRDNSIDFAREGFFRIDVAGLPDALVSAALRLTLRSVNEAAPHNYDVVLMEIPDTGWAESGADATWNAILGAGAGQTAVPAPDDPAVIERFYLPDWPVGTARDFDITRHARAAQARGAPTLMVQVIGTVAGASNNFVIHSRQAADLAVVPQVVYTVARRPAPATLLWLK